MPTQKTPKRPATANSAGRSRPERRGDGSGACPNGGSRLSGARLGPVGGVDGPVGFAAGRPQPEQNTASDDSGAPHESQ